MKKTSMLLAALVALPAFAAAQDNTAPSAPPAAAAPSGAPDVQKDREAVRDDAGKLKSLDAQHADALKDLNAKEKEALEAIKKDATLSPDQRKAKLADARKDYRTQRKALNEKFRSDRKALRDTLRTDRQSLRQDRRALRQSAKPSSK